MKVLRYSTNINDEEVQVIASSELNLFGDYIVSLHKGKELIKEFICTSKSQSTFFFNALVKARVR